MRYFLLDGTEQRGPYTVEQLREFAEQGNLHTDDLLGTEDGSGRIRAGLVVGIFGPVPRPAEEPIHEAAPEDPRARRRFLTTAVILIVLALVVPLTAITFSIAAIQRKNRQLQAEAMDHLKNLVTATFAYAADNGDSLPPFKVDSENMVPLLAKYAGSTKIENTQANRTGWQANLDVGGMRLGSIDQPKITPMFYDSEAWPDGNGLVAMADGSVQWMKIKDLNDLVSKRRLELKKNRATEKTGSPNAGLSPQTSLTPGPAEASATPLQK